MSDATETRPSIRWLAAVLSFAAAATLATIAFDSSAAHERAGRALVDPAASGLGDPGPSLMAATRLAHTWHAPLYQSFSPVGSSFIYPPIAALPYAPLADTAPEQANAALSRVSRAAYVACVLIAGLLAWQRRHRTFVVFFLIWAALCYFPLLRAVQLNQATLLVAVCLGAGLLGAERGALVIAGVCCAVAAAFKPQLALMAPLVAIYSRRVALAMVAALAALGLASVAYGGWANHVDYLLQVLPQLSGGYAFYPNQSWNGTFLRLAGATPFTFALPPVPAWVRVAGGVCTIGTLVAGALVLRHARRQTTRELALPLALAFAWLIVTLASPVSWEHHYVPALFVFALMMRHALAGEATRAQVALAAMAAPLMAGYFDVHGWAGSTPGRLAMSYLLAGAIALATAVGWQLVTQAKTRAPQNLAA